MSQNQKQFTNSHFRQKSDDIKINMSKYKKYSWEGFS
jgi:hypothetical protein